MEKQKTITVMECDFCVESQNHTWKCAHCQKDACENCGRLLEIYSYQQRSPSNPALTFGVVFRSSQSAEFAAFICNDCARNELSTHLLQFGFKLLVLQHEETPQVIHV